MATAEPAKAARRPVSRRSTPELITRRQREIAEVATRLVAEQGFARTVVRDIARAANVSVGTVYEYVRSKEDILFLIIEYWSEVWISGLKEALQTGDDPLVRLYSAVEFLVNGTDAHPDLVHLLYREQGNLNDLARDLLKKNEAKRIRMLTAVIKDAVQQGQVRPDINPDVAASALLFLSDGWALKGYVLRRTQEVSDWVGWVYQAVIGTHLAQGTDRGRP